MVIPILLGAGALVAIGIAAKKARAGDPVIDDGVDELDQPPGEQDEEIIIEGSEAAEENGATDTASALRVAAIVAAWNKQAGVFKQNMRPLLAAYYRARVAPSRDELLDILEAMPNHVDDGVENVIEKMLERGDVAGSDGGLYPWRLSEILSLGANLGFGFPDPVQAPDFSGDLMHDADVADWLDIVEQGAKGWALAQGYLVDYGDGAVGPEGHLEGDEFGDDDGGNLGDDLAELEELLE